MKKTDLPHEILIRFDEAGTLKGAHYVARRVVTVDGEVIKDEVQPPVPVRLAADAKLETGAPETAKLLADVLSDVLVQALASADTANEQNAAAKTTIEDLEARLEKAEARAAGAKDPEAADTPRSARH
jgi:D-ribose pyranose/furanose isomerase RbsD